MTLHMAGSLFIDRSVYLVLAQDTKIPIRSQGKGPSPGLAVKTKSYLSRNY